MSRVRISIQGVCLFFFLSFFGQTAGASEGQLDPRILEVYGSRAEHLSPEQLAWLNNQLSRCEIIEEPSDPTEPYLLISQVPLLDKYVSQLQINHPDIQSFNPLKYAIDFHKKTDMKYRIDGTPYVLLVRKKQ